MNKWFEKCLARVMHPRARKHNVKRPKKFVRPSSNLEVVLDELQHPIDIGRQNPAPAPYMLKPTLHENLGGVGAVAEIAFAAAMDGVEAVKKQLDKKERMLKLEKRRKYYAAEAEKRLFSKIGHGHSGRSYLLAS